MTEEWEAPDRATRIGNPVKADQQSIAAGKAIFQGWCLACHDNMGKGNGPAAYALERPPSDLSMPMMWKHSDGALFWKITEGRPPMPSFKKLLTADERWQVVNYIRTLAAQSDRADMSRKPRNGASMEQMH
jgi:mono/diheme cytochrome c family protein